LGFAGAVSNIEFDTYLIMTAPETMLARITGIARLVSFMACAAGPLIGGFLFEMCGAQVTVSWLMAATIFLAACSLFIPSIRARGNYDITKVKGQADQEASAWDMIIGRQLGNLASFLDALNVFARYDRVHGLPEVPAGPIGEPSPRPAERVSSGSASI